MPDPPATLEIRPGAPLPGGTYRLGSDRHDRLVAAVGGVRPADGSAHPLAAWVIAMGGCGVTIEALFGAAGVAMEDGPMLGSCDVELERPLGPETAYDVRGRIIDIEEKSGRRIGRFDVMRVELTLSEPDGTHAGTCTAAMILPRPAAAA